MTQEFTIRKAVEFAIKTEELGGKFYRKMAKKFADKEEVSEVFFGLADEEDSHEKLFKQLLDGVPQDEHVSSQADQMEYLRAMSMTEFFMGADGMYRNLDEIENSEDAMFRAFRLEKSVLGFFMALKEVLPESEVIDSIIATEKGHLTQVMKYLVADGFFLRNEASID